MCAHCISGLPHTGGPNMAHIAKLTEMHRTSKYWVWDCTVTGTSKEWDTGESTNAQIQLQLSPLTWWIGNASIAAEFDSANCVCPDFNYYSFRHLAEHWTPKGMYHKHIDGTRHIYQTKYSTLNYYFLSWVRLAKYIDPNIWSHI